MVISLGFSNDDGEMDKGLVAELVIMASAAGVGKYPIENVQ